SILLLAARRGRATDVVEDLAVLEAVVRKPLHLAILVEVDRDDAAVDLLLRQKRSLLRALRDIVEHLAADGCDRRGRTQHDHHLLLRGAERKLLQRAFWNHVAMVIDLGTTADRHAGKYRSAEGE